MPSAVSNRKPNCGLNKMGPRFLTSGNLLALIICGFLYHQWLLRLQSSHPPSKTEGSKTKGRRAVQTKQVLSFFSGKQKCSRSHKEG